VIKSIIDILDNWEIDFKAFLAKLVLGLSILLIFYIIGKLTKHLAYKINSKVLSKHKDLQSILSGIIYYFFLLIGYYLFLQVIGLEQYFVKLLAGAGIVGIIAGFALKDIASNAFSGLLLFFEKPYVVNDWIQIDGHFGKVLKVGLLTTWMTNKSGQIVYISNQLIYSGVFINYTTLNKRVIRFQADIESYFDIDELRKLFNNSLKNVKNFVASEEIIFLVKSIGVDGNFTLDISFWVTFSNEKEFINSVSDVMILVKKISVDNKFNIINTVWISDEDNNSSAGMYGNV